MIATKKNSKIEKIACQILSLQTFLKKKTNKYLDLQMSREESKFYKKYGVEPREKDREEIKKDMIMRMGTVFIVIVFILVVIFM